MFDLNPDDMLSKIHQYKLDRPDGWCYISVHEVLASEKAKISFIAVPNMAVQQAEAQYYGTGDSSETALADCIGKVKSIPIKALFPKLDEAYAQVEQTLEPSE